MKTRVLALLLVLPLGLACATDTPPEEPAPAEEVAPTDEEAIDAVRVAYVDAYNAGDVEGVVALFSDEAVTLFADSGVSMGRDAIRESTTAALAAGPTADIDAAETMVFGDRAVSRGSYSVSMTPEGGEAVSFNGHYLTVFSREMGEWKIDAVISNYDAAPPAGLPQGTMPAEGEGADELVDNPLADFTASYADHFNQGHASVVAGLYAEDAVVAFADMPLAEGRAAVEAALQQRVDAGTQLAIHTVAAEDMGDGWWVTGGWYDATVAGNTRQGNWITLMRTAADGSRQIQWAVTNIAHPAM